jgi:hypothetical protein
MAPCINSFSSIVFVWSLTLTFETHPRLIITRITSRDCILIRIWTKMRQMMNKYRSSCWRKRSDIKGLGCSKWFFHYVRELNCRVWTSIFCRRLVQPQYRRCPLGAPLAGAISQWLRQPLQATTAAQSCHTALVVEETPEGTARRMPFGRVPYRNLVDVANEPLRG